MIDRRSLLARALIAPLIAPLIGPFLAGARALGAAAEVDKVILKQDLPSLAMHGWRMTAIEVTYGPGELDTAHRHPGFVFGYVIDGALRFGLDGQPPTIYRTGQMFYEPPGSVHRVSGNDSATHPVRFLAMIFADAASALTTPV